MPQTEIENRAAATASEEAELVTRLRAGDEQSFAALVDTYHSTMLAVARTYVKSRAVAEEVVQDAWIGVLKGLDRFEGRSSLKTWILRIVVNTAMTRGGREARSVPFSALVSEEEDPAVAIERFRGPDAGFPGHWQAYPTNWRSLPEHALAGHETLDVVKRAIAELPPAQRAVITLRDIQGCAADEVCDALELTDGNQRVLLHRARSHVRAALEMHFDD